MQVRLAHRRSVFTPSAPTVLRRSIVPAVRLVCGSRSALHVPLRNLQPIFSNTSRQKSTEVLKCKICNGERKSLTNPLITCKNDGRLGIPACSDIQAKSKTFKTRGTNAFHFVCLKSSSNARYRKHTHLMDLRSKKHPWWCNPCLHAFQKTLTNTAHPHSETTLMDLVLQKYDELNLLPMHHGQEELLEVESQSSQQENQKKKPSNRDPVLEKKQQKPVEQLLPAQVAEGLTPKPNEEGPILITAIKKPVLNTKNDKPKTKVTLVTASTTKPDQKTSTNDSSENNIERFKTSDRTREIDNPEKERPSIFLIPDTQIAKIAQRKTGSRAGKLKQKIRDTEESIVKKNKDKEAQEKETLLPEGQSAPSSSQQPKTEELAASAPPPSHTAESSAKERILAKGPSSVLQPKNPTKKSLRAKLELLNQAEPEGPRIVTLAELSRDQRNVLEFVEKGFNIFFTGSAGTGKSYLLQKLKDLLHNQGKVVAVTASTGIAAVNIGGVTLHHWSGLGISGEFEAAVKAARRQLKNWKKSDVLIIDEISMLSGQMFELLERVARAIRGVDAPFGGLQLILTGDFFQLPPVTKRDDPAAASSFAFESRAWKDSIDVCIEMSEIFRQTDPVFINMLNKIRVGTVDDTVMEILNKARENDISEKSMRDGILPTVLYARNSHVDRLNNLRLQHLEGEAEIFKSVDKSALDIPYQHLVVLLNGCMAPRELHLKLNSQVMLLKNQSATLINGSRGVVIGFEDAVEPDTKWPRRPVVQFSNGEIKTINPDNFRIDTANNSVTRTQIPLKLAYALTIHKSQGLSIDRAKVSLANVFEPGQTYVALSRIRSLEGLQVLDWSKSGIVANRRVLQFYSEKEGSVWV